MATWVVGDIHGCASELATLLERIGLGADDQFVSVGDLFHRGPDPVGVARLLAEVESIWILGNHERAALRRLGLDPKRADGSDVRGRAARRGALDTALLAGDGDRALVAEPGDLAELLAYLQTHRGYFLEHSSIRGAGPTRDGRAWCVVHAGLVPGSPPGEATPFELTRMRKLDAPGRPFWFQEYSGPSLVLFGHTPFPEPRRVEHDGQLVALGLDTGCVFGGSLTAYCPERDELIIVPAQRSYASL